MSNGNDPSAPELSEWYCTRCLRDFYADEPEAVEAWVNGIPYCQSCYEKVTEERENVMTEREMQLEALLSECSGTFLALALGGGLGPNAAMRCRDMRTKIAQTLTPKSEEQVA